MGDGNLLDLLDPKFPLVFEGIIPKETRFQMTKSRLSKECSVCERPFTVFFWRSHNIPYKTVICQLCAKSANVCQVSLLDLDLGIPVIVRNRIMHLKKEDYKSSTRRWYNNRLIDRKISNGEEWFDGSLRDRILAIDPVVVKRVQQLVDADPYLSFRKSPVCPEWLGNECRHGAACYYAHELPNPGQHSPDLSKFGIRCRYLGTVDPNGTAILEKLMMMDQTLFQADRGQKEVQSKTKQVAIPKSNEDNFEVEKPVECPMHPPESEESLEADFDGPVPYEELNGFDFSVLPKFSNGMLLAKG
jgi:pre-mRNA-splicing factor RBM22/SLT11